MDDTITIPRAEYERLIAIAEDAGDIRDADRIMAALARGEEERIPAEFANRLIGGESPLRVYRELRGLSGAALATRAGVNRVQILDIEAGRKAGSVDTLGKLARALGVTIDDLVD